MSTTPETPDFTQWQQVIDLLRQAATEQKEDALLQLLLTPDERDALLARVNIVHELLNGQRSQRKISELLGVGVATITRGSNELKHQDEATKAWIGEQLKQMADKQQKNQ
ncbi:TPA: trp operon repressor [Photobacterium damselae]